MKETIDPRDRVLADLANLLEQPSEIRGNTLFIPGWNLTIRPEVSQFDERIVVLDFYLSHADWDRELYECSAALGQDQETAVGMAEGGFLFGMLNGVEALLEDAPKHILESEYAGKKHRWDCFESNIVGMGDTPKEYTGGFWDLLEADIVKRLGNQKLCYIKVFGSKNGDQVTGECRINDVASVELGEKVAACVRQWDTRQFGTQKQIFFLRQQPDTYEPYPYTQADMEGLTQKAVRLFEACMSGQYDYENYVELLTQEIGDRDLAEEFYSFLPEFCAENAFDQVHYPDSCGVYQNGAQTEVYKSQFASYDRMHAAIFHGFEAGLYDNETFRNYVAVSSSGKVLMDAQQKGADLSASGGRMFVSFGFSDCYRLR